MALAKAEILSGQFRTSEATNARVFMASWAAVMADFPPVVLDAVCHPAKGIAIRQNFVPSVHELREELISVMNTMIARWRLDQLPPERRAAIAHGVKALLEAPRETRPSYDELKAKYGDNWGIDQSDPRPNRNAPFKVPTLGEVSQRYIALGTKNPLLKKSDLSGGRHDYGQYPTQEKNSEQSEGDQTVVADALPHGGQDDQQGGSREAAETGGEFASAGEGGQETAEADFG